ncbi:MAG: LURP-one-related family protein [Oscillospiraceae bacterium]|jgi:uncharacterized protein YxjI|nr:LURP-one-related family protein [Oscillospiraceae bacterium]
MKMLYIKQKVFSLGGRFSVLDEQENQCWSAKGDIFTIGRRLHVFDENGKEVALIRRKWLSLRPAYYIQAGKYVYTLSKRITFFMPCYHLDRVNWTISGDLFAHNYDITDAHGIISRVYKRWFTLGDRYYLDVRRETEELLSLCVTLAVDCMKADFSSDLGSDAY